jgi:hypothetical protein
MLLQEVLRIQHIQQGFATIFDNQRNVVETLDAVLDKVDAEEVRNLIE